VLDIISDLADVAYEKFADIGYGRLVFRLPAAFPLIGEALVGG